MSDAALVRMPKLADTLVEGTLGRWLKRVGERVGRGEPLASIETDKVTTELTSPSAGTLLELLVEEGQTVPVETPIARIGDPTSSSPAHTSPPPPQVDESSGPPGPPLATVVNAPPPVSANASSGPVPVTVNVSPVAPSAPPGPPSLTTVDAPPPKATPVAKRILAEHGLTTNQVPTSAGRITKRDVLAVVQSRATSPPKLPAVTPLTSMRRAIAEHMTHAAQTIPHGETVMAADLTDLVAWRDQHKAEGITFTVLFVNALARHLASFVDPPVDIGVAVALDHGLIVPVLRKADQLNLLDTATALADIASRARTNRLTPDETQGARMTVTNVGSFGNLTASPIIPLGQLGMIGPGLVERRPMPGADGSIRAGWRCLLALMFDRRILDDFAADRFLRGVIDQLLAPVR